MENLSHGYIKAYLPGVRENGGQYTHSAVWAIIAMACLSLNKNAERAFRMINPINHSDKPEKQAIYKVEPYVVPADVYGTSNLRGRGGWTWYTGSSGWFYKAGIEYILGLKVREGMLSIMPCIPSYFDEYSIRYEYKSSVYNIKVRNLSKAEPNVVRVFRLNGEIIPDKQIKLIDNGKIYEIEVEL